MDYTTFLTPSLGVGGLLAFAIWLILKGLIVPKSTMDARIADKDAQIEIWKGAYDRAEKAIEMKDRQIERLLEGGRTTAQVITALSEAAGIEGGRHALAPPEE